MEKQIISFSANEQILKKTAGQERFADDVVGYIEAHFDLGDNWSGYDSIRAVWFTAFAQISTVLDHHGVCLVPPEVCNRKEAVNVNLVGSIANGDELTDRLTTYPIVAFVFDGNARVEGSETTPITPSQFEQFAEAVRENADRAEAAEDNAADYAASAEADADRAEQAAANAGYMFFHIDDDPESPTYGHLIYERTSNTEVDFYISNGHLYVEAAA